MTKEIIWWKPEMTGRELSLLKEVLDSNFLNDGNLTIDFEKLVAQRVGAKYAVATTSGTVALYLSLKALGIGHGDEVVVPDITFIATANAVTMTGASPILVDVDASTLSMCPRSFETAINNRTRAVIPVHISGRGGTFREVARVADKHNIPVIEDAAEALGSKFKDHFLGTRGIAGCFSFSPNKTITTGQGGMIVTNDWNIAARLRELKDQGRPLRGTGGDDLHPTVGFNFKFTNLQAAVGLAQMDHLEARQIRQSRIFSIYQEELRKTNEVTLFDCDLENGETPQWTDILASDRDKLEAFLLGENIHCRKFWHPLHSQTPYKQEDDSAFPVSSKICSKALWLPSAFQMTDEQVCLVADRIKYFYQKRKLNK